MSVKNHPLYRAWLNACRNGISDEWRKNFPDDRPEAVKDFAAMTRAYWGTILSVDDSVGKLVAELRRRGDLDNTIIVFMGDNGLLEGEHGMVDKRTMHEPSIRIPLIARHKGFRPGHVEKRMVLTTDLAPSLLELCGASGLPAHHAGQGVRLLGGAGVTSGPRVHGGAHVGAHQHRALSAAAAPGGVPLQRSRLAVRRRVRE